MPNYRRIKIQAKCSDGKFRKAEIACVHFYQTEMLKIRAAQKRKVVFRCSVHANGAQRTGRCEGVVDGGQLCYKFIGALTGE